MSSNLASPRCSVALLLRSWLSTSARHVTSPHVIRCSKCCGMDCLSTCFTHAQTCDMTFLFKMLQGMQCLGAYLHMPQSATEGTASVHTATHNLKAVAGRPSCRVTSRHMSQAGHFSTREQRLKRVTVLPGIGQTACLSNGATALPHKAELRHRSRTRWKHISESNGRLLVMPLPPSEQIDKLLYGVTHIMVGTAAQCKNSWYLGLFKISCWASLALGRRLT